MDIQFMSSLKWISYIAPPACPVLTQKSEVITELMLLYIATQLKMPPGFKVLIFVTQTKMPVVLNIVIAYIIIQIILSADSKTLFIYFD